MLPRSCGVPERISACRAVSCNRCQEVELAAAEVSVRSAPPHSDVASVVFDGG